MGLLDNISDLAKKAQSAVTGDAEDVKARHEMEDGEVKDAWAKAASQMAEPLSPDIEKHLQDILVEGERVIFKVRSSPTGERSQMALTNRNLFIFCKGIFGGQGQDTGGGLIGLAMARGRVSMRIYPLKSILGFEIQPQKGITVGHFQVLTAMTRENDNESKFLLDTKLGYFKSMLVYRKIMELQSGDQREAMWYYTKDSKTRYGPIPLAQLKALVRSGELQPAHLLMKDGSSKWVRVDQATEVSS